MSHAARMIAAFVTGATLLAMAMPSAAAPSAVPAPSAEADGCPPALCAALHRSESPLPFPVPDPRGLAGARSLSEALAVTVPGFPDVPLSPPRSLRAELRWWAGRLGRPAPGPLPDLPPGLRRAAAWLLGGARQAEAIRAAAAPFGPGELAAAWDLLQHPLVRPDPRLPGTPDPRLGTLADRVDLAGMKRAAAVVAAAADRALALLPPAAGGSAVCDGEPTDPDEVGGMVALDADGTRTRYAKPYLLSIDLGGCDEYLNEAGGARGPDRPAGIALDLGADPDLYSAPPETYSQGAASEGIGVLVDAGGDDVYQASGYANQGSGIVGGVGILADLGGSDRYDLLGSGGGFGAQGQATIGFGALVDLGGDDTYSYVFDPGEAGFGSRVLSAQGAAIVASVAVLADAEGDDRYLARTLGNIVTMEAQGVGFFIPPGTAGLLIDPSGDDEYVVEARVASADAVASGGVEGQGIGFFDAAGLLLDGAGEDRYVLDAEGSGAAGSVVGAFGQGGAAGSLRDPAGGLLLDLSGDDAYETRAVSAAGDPTNAFAGTLTAGVGTLDGVGVLADLVGDDAYVQEVAASGEADSLGQGAGFGAALGVLLDRAGSDTYLAGPRSQGYGGAVEAPDFTVPGGVGVLLDAAGRDTFSGPGSGSSFWTQGEDGFGVGASGGNGWATVLGLLDLFFGPIRPHPFVTAEVTEPTAELHGDATIAGTASGDVFDVDAVEWRADGSPWRVARKGTTWATWSDPLDVDALADGEHLLQARAWAGYLDSAVAFVTVAVERWLPTWDVRPEGEAVRIGFDLATRAGDPVDSAEVALEVATAAGETLAVFDTGLSQGGGRYEALWTPPGAGAYRLRAVVPGQMLGETSLEV